MMCMPESLITASAFKCLQQEHAVLSSAGAINPKGCALQAMRHKFRIRVWTTAWQSTPKGADRVGSPACILHRATVPTVWGRDSHKPERVSPCQILQVTCVQFLRRSIVFKRAKKSARTQ